MPWSIGLTKEASDRLVRHYGTDDIEGPMGNHLLPLGSLRMIAGEPVGPNRVRDRFGVTWDRTENKDIGIPVPGTLPSPSLAGYQFPDPVSPLLFGGIEADIRRYPDRFRVFRIDFSLYERAWTLRGLEDLMMDLYDNPRFVHQLLEAIADFNIAVVREALRYDIDAVYFGDDWGQQRGLQMGPTAWRNFILPQLRRMYGEVRSAGKFVFIHSCGDVDELFDDLVDAGVNCFNPFQPEVMDVHRLVPAYRGRLTFHGGLSIQDTLPFGTAEAVRTECRRLLELGREGGYIFAAAHDVPSDVPLENILAMLEVVQGQR